MSLKTVSDLKDSVSGILSGTNLNNVTNLYGALERAARGLITKVDVPEAGGTYPVTLYNGVFDYAAPSTIFGASLLDFRPQGNGRGANDYAYRSGIERFDRLKKQQANGYNVTFEFDNGTPIMRVASPKPTSRIVLDGINSTTGWTVGGSGSSLALDQITYYDNNASLRLNLTGASSGYLEKSITSQDLTSYQSVGVVFIPIWTPSSSLLTSVTLRLGSSATDYYSVAATTGFIGSFKANGWTLLAFDLSQASTTGSPTITAMDYARITIAHTGTLTNFRIGGFWISLPSPHEIVYQSAAIFLPSGQTTPLQTISEDSDTLILQDNSYLIYEFEAAKEIAIQLNQDKKVLEINRTLFGVPGTDNKGLYGPYSADNPSQSLRLVGNYLD